MTIVLDTVRVESVISSSRLLSLSKSLGVNLKRLNKRFVEFYYCSFPRVLLLTNIFFMCFTSFKNNKIKVFKKSDEKFQTNR